MLTEPDYAGFGLEWAGKREEVMTPFKFEMGQIIHRVTDVGTWRMGGAGVVVARAESQHMGFVGTRNEYFVAWADGVRTWHAEPELCCLESEKPIDKP